MMSSVLTLGDAPHIRVRSLQEEGTLLLVVVEANLKNPASFHGGILDAVVDDATERMHRPIGLGTAHEYARALADAIMADEERWRTIGAVFFAAVALRKNVAEVCTAGDLRVHLIHDRVARQVTRDHNVVSDDDDGLYTSSGSGRSDLGTDFLVHVPTRAIPSGQGKSVECVNWVVPEGGGILICSSRLHQYRAPETYVATAFDASRIPPLALSAIVEVHS